VEYSGDLRASKPSSEFGMGSIRTWSGLHPRELVSTTDASPLENNS